MYDVMSVLSTYAHGEFLHVAGIMHDVRYQIILRLETREGVDMDMWVDAVRLGLFEVMKRI